MRLFYSQSLIPALLCLQVTAVPAMCAAEDRPSKRVNSGDTISLLQEWPVVSSAPKDQLGTMEIWIIPDSETLARSRSFLITLSNQGGADLAGLSLTLHKGVPRANVLATKLVSDQPLTPGQWHHIALTVNTMTINKQARLWIDGRLVADQLVLEKWPNTFEVAQLLSDKWGQGRCFSGQLGQVRFSGSVRYDADFHPPALLKSDDQTTLLLPADPGSDGI